MNTRFVTLTAALVLAAGLLVGCDALAADPEGNLIQASGVMEAEEISVSSEISGKVKEVHVEEGDSVEAGELLFTLEDDLLLRQLDQAQAVYDSALAQRQGARANIAAAQAALDLADSSLTAAQIQQDQVLANSLSLSQAGRVDDWNRQPPANVELPAWYFEQEELISAAEQEVSIAWGFYQIESSKLTDLSAEISSQDFLEAEKRLLEAQAAFDVADQLRDRQVGYRESDYLRDFIDTIFAKAESELKAAQKAYNEILADPEYEQILEARARVSVAKERYDLALGSLNALKQGENSLEVQAAKALVAQAEAGQAGAKAQLALAEANFQAAANAVQQAEASLGLAKLQVEKLSIHSPLSGVVLTRNVKPGEVLGAGSTAITVGNLEQLSVTVYLPENRYGQVSLGDAAELRVDSYPELVFEAAVVRIADQAEYTPRNVQTQEERQNTVYAVKLAVNDPTGKLKPGMPADVEFLP